jgi:hypothetical protein
VKHLCVSRNFIIYLALLILVFSYRYLVLLHFSFKYTDSDQTIMWLGVKDYSSGIFHEPRFYGQSYNSMLESLFSVPLYITGIPPAKALPFVSAIFSLLPFILISFFTFVKKGPRLSFLILFIPLLLPPEYSFITSMPRGFVSGLFIAGFISIPVFFKGRSYGFFLAGFISVLSFSINSNSVLFSIPCLLLMTVENPRNRKFYFLAGTGIIAGFCLHFMINYFYVAHPFYDLHKMELYFSFQLIIESLAHLDIFFNHVSPLFWHAGSLLLFIFILLALLLYKQKKFRETTIVLLIPLLILITLGINKTHDGTESVFFSNARMYLALPLLLALAVSFFDEIKSRYFNFTLLIPAFSFIYQLNILEQAVHKNIDPSLNHIVSVAKVEDLQKECSDIQKLSERHHVQLIIVSSHWNYDSYTYGCPACAAKFPETLRPSYERRTWRLLEDEKKTYPVILIVDVNSQLPHIDFIKETELTGFYLIENNTLPTMELLKVLHINCRKYK